MYRIIIDNTRIIETRNVRVLYALMGDSNVKSYQYSRGVWYITTKDGRKS